MSRRKVRGSICADVLVVVLGLSSFGAQASFAESPPERMKRLEAALDKQGDFDLRGAVLGFYEANPCTLSQSAGSYVSAARFDELYPDSLWTRT